MLIQQAVAKTLESLRFVKLENEMLDMKDSGYKLPAPPSSQPIQTVTIDQSNIHQMPQIINSLQGLQHRQQLEAQIFQIIQPTDC